ncbi:hypothetical protein B0H21DRAFT_826627 [Amylocystis lapponica]|nr:hypothetical protein B0H21DRAFT_826627 [Amylocystis lapponica]
MLRELARVLLLDGRWLHRDSGETTLQLPLLITTGSRPTTVYAQQEVILPRDEFAAVLASNSTSATASDDTPSASNDLGPILGGLFGGFFGLFVIVAAIWYIWHRRRHLCCSRDDVSETPSLSPVPDPKVLVRAQHSPVPPVPPLPPPSPTPYQYGLVGRPRSHRSSSVPYQPQTPSAYSQSRPHSQSLSLSSVPPSAYNATHSRAGSGAATPLPGTGTSLSPGPSLAPSSRSSTPAPSTALQHYRLELQQQQQQQERLSWPRYGGSEEGGDERRSPVLRPHSERRPSRLSLTFGNWSLRTDSEHGEPQEQAVHEEGTAPITGNAPA